MSSTAVSSACHRQVHQLGLVSLDEETCPAVAAEELLQLLSRDAGA
jgi:hypothetical protein